MKRFLYVLMSIAFLWGSAYSNTINVPADYSTIQAAINAANNGDDILVASGTYTENLTVNKQVTIKSSAGAASTILNGYITITSDIVTIDGFTLKNSSTSYFVYSVDNSFITLQNNIFDGTGISSVYQAIYIKSASAYVSTIKILNNTIENINHNSSSTKAIFFGDSNGNYDIDHVLIQNNTITNITSWNTGTSSGHGAYGILVNHSNSGGSGQTTNLQIKGNSISSLEGAWAHAIGLEGNTPDAVITGNNISNITDHSSPTDAAALYVGDNNTDNAYGSTLTVSGNTFSSVNLGVENKTDSTIYASSNTYGAGVSSTGPVTTLSAPANLTPNGTSGVSFTPTLKYDAVTNNINSEAIQYTVQLSPQSDFSNSHLYQLYNVNNHTSQTVPFGRLNASTTYYWRVWAETETTHRVSDTSTASFTTKSVNLVQPGNTLTGVSLLPTFIWDEANVNSGSYTLKIGTSSGSYSITVPITVGSNATLSSNKITFNSTEVELGQYLETNTKYYWTVSYTDNSGNSQTYSEHTFTTVSNLNLSLSYPADGVSVYNYSNMMFTWFISKATGSTTFKVQVCRNTSTPTPTDWADASITQTFDAGGNLNYTTSNNFYGGTKYYWRVIAESSNGNIVKVSAVNDFTTKGGPILAYPSYPSSSNTVYTLTPTFYWYTGAYEPDASFHIIIATSNTLSGDSLNTGIYNSSSSSTSGYYFDLPSGKIDYNTTYYWQIVTVYNGATTKYAYSDVESFTTYPDPTDIAVTPTASYPTGGIDVYTLTPTFYWYIDKQSTNIDYTVYYKDSTTNPSGSFTALSAVTDQLYTSIGSDLNAGDTYVWYVKAENSHGTTKYSGHASFTIVGGSSSTPVLLQPSDGSTVYSTTPTLTWRVEGSTLGWDSYKLQYREGTSGGWTTKTISDINSYSYTFPDNVLTFGTTYQWQVELYNSGSSSGGGYVGPQSFTVYGDTASFTIIQSSPYDGATNITTSPSLYWYISGVSAGIIGYTVYYTPYADPSQDPSIAHVSSGTDTYVDLTNLNGGTTYKWRVKASTANGDDKYSGWFSFTTEANNGTVQPKVGSPINSIGISTSNAVLSWHTPVSAPQGQTYTVEYSQDKSFSNAKVINNVNSEYVKVSGLNTGDYYWRVKGVNSKGESFYSGTGTFKVTSVTGVDNAENLIPKTFEVSQNYPNPFNPSTVIRYAIPKAAHVTVRIYNSLGQQIRTLVNSEKDAGTYNVQWNGMDNNGNKVSSGIYIYRVTAGPNIKSMKMILLK